MTKESTTAIGVFVLVAALAGSTLRAESETTIEELFAEAFALLLAG